MGLTQNVLNKLFPGNTGVSVPFGTVENVGNYHGTEQGVDIGYGPNGAGTPVNLIASGKYLGQAAGGYVDVFSNDVTGAIDYYQHIVSAQGLQVGHEYAYQTQIGTVAPLSVTPSGYSSSGPHLEFGTLLSAPSPGAQYVQYANVDPTQEILASASGLAKDVIGSDQGLNLTTNTTKTPTQIIQTQNQPTTNPVQGVVQGLLQLPSIGGVSIGGTLVFIGLGLAGIVLLYALVRGGNNGN